MEYKFLSNIKSPKDVKKLNTEELKILCSEIRECMIDTVSKNGGHLASNLGTVELTVGLHKVFNAPEDNIIFDVGHQCYTHKLLTGRFDRFDTIRCENGLSGFMRPDESIYDPFVTGHSGNAISAAYGIYKAKQLKGKTGYSIAVVGDGAMTGGMTYEAMNNAGNGKGGFIVILNDNKMSISRNVGSFARCLTIMRLKPSYHNFKRRLKKFLDYIPVIGPKIAHKLFKSKTIFKNAVYKSNIFENMGFNYLGPIDGHDLESLINVFEIAKQKNKPVIIHTVTIKGKGYSFAENDPKNYHGVSSFDIKEGTTNNNKVTYSDICGQTLCELAQIDNKVCAITAAMTVGTGLDEFSKKYPDRFFDVGIAEEHAATFAGGMAAGGVKPYFVVYSSFLQRSYDQLIHDISIANLPVTICVDRAGIVGEDGESHQGLFDVAFLGTIPNMTVYSPCYFGELKEILLNSQNATSPIAIRYPRGSEPKNDEYNYSGNDFDVFGSGEKAIVTYGRVFDNAINAQKQLNDTAVIKINKVLPLSKDFVDTIRKFKKVYFFEEGIKKGSIAETLGAALLEEMAYCEYKIFAIDNTFVSQSSVEAALKKYKLDTQSIIKIVKEEN